MKRTLQVSAMLVAGAMAGLAGCSEPQVQAPPSTVATTRQQLDGPALLKDIHTGAVGFPQLGWSPTMSRPLPSGGTLVTLEEPFTGEELWRTDGTAAGTTLVKDIAPGLWSSSPSGFTDFNGAIYFGAETDFGQSALMKSDGTAAGTVAGKYLSNLQEPDDQAFESLVTAGGALYFIQADQLWKSNGTEAGTVSIQNLLPPTLSYFRSGLVPMGSSVYFVAEDPDQAGSLWKTDGTASGTVKIKDLSSSSSFDLGLVVVGQTLFFSDGPFNARELWKTDGTAAGTTLVRAQSGSLGELTVVGTQLFFRTNSVLWRTDGTTAGTVQLPASNVQGLTAVGGTLFFSAEDASGVELWKSDGSSAGTRRVKDLLPGSDSSYVTPLGAWNGRLLFLAAPGAGRAGLWSSDGTDGGTVLLAERPGASDSYFYSSKPVLPVGAAVLAELPVSLEGRVVFRTDGTPSGTVELGSVRAGTKDSQVSALPLAVVGSKVFFQARDAEGTALWVSDGTSGGTVRLQRFSSQVGSAARVGSTLYFSAADDTSGEELWKSDGTAAGTVRVKDLLAGAEGSSPYNLTEFAGALYFSAGDGVNGHELWKSDGTAAGTVMVRDVFPGEEGSSPREFAVLNGTLFFAASDTPLTDGLWKTDGTAAGTVKVRDGYVDDALAGGNTLFFFADDGAGMDGLWKTDGTAAGTVKVRGGLDQVVFPVWANGKLYFIALDEAHGFEPWVSDGTTEGTRVLKDIGTGSNPSFGLGFTALGNRVLFTARDDAHGFELWSTDGTEAGTQRVTDLWPGATSGTRLNPDDDDFSSPFEMLALADRGLAVFTGQDEAGGSELWVTDGTAQGTSRYVDVAPGAASSYPTGFAAVGGQLFFFAGDAAYGREPRAVPLPTASLDRTPPAVSCPSNVAATTADAQGTSVEYPAATASDAGGTATLAYSQASGTRFAPGDTVVTVTATDSAGNTAQCRFTVTVRLEQAPAPAPEDEGGCGCASSLGAGAGARWGMLLLALASLRPGRRASKKEAP